MGGKNEYNIELILQRNDSAEYREKSSLLARGYSDQDVTLTANKMIMMRIHI